MSRQILNGWKQISNHIERGVRTAQRWEVLLGMPVHRPALKDRSAVVAFSDELEQWLSRTSPDAQDRCIDIHDKKEGYDRFLRVLENMNALIRQSRQLIRQIRVLQKPRRRSHKIHRQRITSRTRVHNTLAPGSGRLLAFPQRKRDWGYGLSNFTGRRRLEKAR
jgi:hypothetical protein